MKKLDWWTMYFETQRLKKLGIKISQIARALSLSASDDKKTGAAPERERYINHSNDSRKQQRVMD